jgi:hypothetical protein
MSYQRIEDTLNQIDCVRAKEMTRVNEPYEDTKPTKEDVESIREAVVNNESDADKQALFVVERLWNEVERLRSIIEKQIY